MVPSTIASDQVIGDTHHVLLPVAGLNREDKVGVEVAVIEEVAVPEHDVVDSVVLPDCLRAVRTVDRDVRTR